jgi:diacylglycerol kinase (ATP)
MKVALLHNAKAGDEEFTPKKLTKLLAGAGYKAKYFPLKEALEDEDALNYGEFIVVAGGDGSIRKVATRLVGKKRAIAPLPLGTANNIARSLRIEGPPENVIAGWAKPLHRKLDIGIARGPWGKKYFVEGLGLGLIGRAIAIIEDIDEVSGRVFTTKDDKLHRDLCVMAALAHEMPTTKVKVMLDGKKVRDDFLLFEVLNINRAGPGIELAVEADPCDGWLDVVSATGNERRKLTQSIEKSLSESHHGPIFSAHKIRKLKMAVGKCELRLDDKVVLRSEDFAKWTRDKRAKIEIGLEPKAVECILPESALPLEPGEKKEKPKAGR